MAQVSLKKLLTKILTWINEPHIQKSDPNNTNTIPTYYVAERTDTQTKVGMGIGVGGINHGVYSWELGGVNGTWLIMSNGTHIYLGGADEYHNIAYVPGDSITLNWYGASYLTTGSTQIPMSIPLKRLILANDVTVTNVTMITRQNNAYTHGSAASTRVAWTVSSAGINHHTGLYLNVTRSTTTNAVNNAPIGIDLQCTVTFS